MIIYLTPQAREDRATVIREGDRLTIDDVTFDFSELSEGESITVDSPWVVGPVTRESGHVTLLLILGHGHSAPHETRWPDPVIDPPDGVVEFPPYEVPHEQALDAAETPDSSDAPEASG